MGTDGTAIMFDRLFSRDRSRRTARRAAV